MKKKLGIDSILREGKRSTVGEHWIIVFELDTAVKFPTSFLTSFLRCHKDLQIYPGNLDLPGQTHQK